MTKALKKIPSFALFRDYLNDLFNGILAVIGGSELVRLYQKRLKCHNSRFKTGCEAVSETRCASGFINAFRILYAVIQSGRGGTIYTDDLVDAPYSGKELAI